MNVTSTGNVVITNGNIREQMSLTYVLTNTGSNNVSNAQNVITGSTWTTINTGSLSDFRYGIFYNTNATSSVKIALSSSASYASDLQPGDYCILVGSGSIPIFAQATGASGTVIVQYALVEK